MPGRKTSTVYKESEYATNLVQIMKAGKGPYTRKMLATALGERHPNLYWNELMNAISGTILMDRLSKANRFRPVKGRLGWYELS